MKYYSLIIACGLSASVQAQSFINGSFEKTTASNSCGYNLSNSDINAQMTGTHAFGGYEAIDILREGCIISSIADGDFALGIANEPSNPSNGEAISLELSDALVENQEYQISFKVQAITKYGPQGNLLIGTSSTKDKFGSEVHNAVTKSGEWIEVSFIFVAGKDTKFITIKPVAGVKSWNIVDDFKLK